MAERRSVVNGTILRHLECRMEQVATSEALHVLFPFPDQLVNPRMTGARDPLHAPVATRSVREATGRKVITVQTIDTPLGAMIVGTTDSAVCLLEFADRPTLARQMRRVAARRRAEVVRGAPMLLSRVQAQLDESFDGRRTGFDLPLGVRGTPFQEAVWENVRTIPHGETRSYAEIAQSLGRPEAARAVGRANGDNPLAIVVPCHRVLGSDGGLRGYGGRRWRKRWLLDLEQAPDARP
jgi:O-6-methylguanine DNA methyltransferase